MHRSIDIVLRYASTSDCDLVTAAMLLSLVPASNGLVNQGDKVSPAGLITTVQDMRLSDGV